MSASWFGCRARAGEWALVVTATIGAALGMDAAGLPSAALFAGLAVGLVFSVLRHPDLAIPTPVNLGAYAVTGVLTGQLMTIDVLRSVSTDWLPVLCSLLCTLTLTVVGGPTLERMTALDRPTSVFGLIAGGAAGVIVISDAAGADARLVAVMQYLRVLVVMVCMPLVVIVAPATSSGPALPGTAGGDPAAGLLFVLGASVVGLVFGWLSRIPAGSLLGPLLVAAAVALALPEVAHPPPTFVQDVAFAVIGLQVGLRFNRKHLLLVARALWAITLMIAALLVSCGALGAGMAAWTGRPLLDCYLATTPGGLYAVLAAAIETGADVPFVGSVQVFRLIAVLVAAPLLAAYLNRARTT
ncbi:MAG: AbrB family transcriptional regulator [Actinophytocola sp.]|uniref:AbrB family transcriptional regulator n=1 Tax=Actinophytocola sp. TaxID=1872138 RepID=UPI001321C5C1|nr:AbrB family transcriptional regulator [Actinophytocola sp.]MPZ80064.1 AbrB family transcriptional regulator [Actinophytocola sp.]